MKRHVTNLHICANWNTHNFVTNLHATMYICIHFVSSPSSSLPSYQKNEANTFPSALNIFFGMTLDKSSLHFFLFWVGNNEEQEEQAPWTQLPTYRVMSCNWKENGRMPTNNTILIAILPSSLFPPWYSCSYCNWVKIVCPIMQLWGAYSNAPWLTLSTQINNTV